MIDGAASAGWPLLVVGPPPVADAAHNSRSAALDRLFAEVCADRAVTYVPVLESLSATPAWPVEVAAGDGAHPGAGGYAELADLVRPQWANWLQRPGDRAAPHLGCH